MPNTTAGSILATAGGVGAGLLAGSSIGGLGGPLGAAVGAGVGALLGLIGDIGSGRRVANTMTQNGGPQDIINRMGEALGEWFGQHAQTMDAGLAQHLQSVGFDSATETLADPAAIRNVTVSGCGSISCS